MLTWITVTILAVVSNNYISKSLVLEQENETLKEELYICENPSETE